MQEASTEALLFDLGGVVFQIDFAHAFRHWSACASVPVTTLVSRFRVDELYEQHETGRIEARSYFDGLREMLKIEISNEDFTAGWNAIFEHEPPGLAELLRSLAARMPIYAFSNTNPLHQQVWKQRYAETLSAFREVYTSCDLGLRKPETDAFNRVAASIGLETEEILFFDDTLENVAGARTAGMAAIHVRSVDDIKREVAKFLS